MTTSSGGHHDDAIWRRPSGPPEPAYAEPESAPPARLPAPPDDPSWRRPENAATGRGETGTSPWAGTGQTAPYADPRAAMPYAGPPPTQPPPAGWRPPTVVQPATPRPMPEQDLAALNQAERGARTLTLGIGMIAGSVVLILSCLFCSRLLF